jgi:hypothetical protein
VATNYLAIAFPEKYAGSGKSGKSGINTPSASEPRAGLQHPTTEINETSLPCQPRASTEDTSEAQPLIERTFGKIEVLREDAESRPVSESSGSCSNFEPMIAGLVDKGDLEGLRCCLLDFERNIRDAIGVTKLWTEQTNRPLIDARWAKGEPQ